MKHRSRTPNARTKSKMNHHLGTAIAIVVAGATTASAATLRVPGDFASINAAMGAAQSGDVVLVAEGTYSSFETRPDIGGALVSSVAFLADGVTLRGEGRVVLRLESTVGFPYVIRARGLSDPTRVENIVIENELVDGIGLAAVDVEDLTVASCSASGIGNGNSGEVGMVVLEGNARFEDCEFVANHSAGVFVGEASAVFIECRFVECTNTGISADGGIDRPNPPYTLEVRNCVFERCSANNNQRGGGLNARRMDGLIVENCWFEGTVNSDGPGALKFSIVTPLNAVVITGTVFLDNHTAFSGSGGGVFGTSQAPVLVTECTFYGNSQQQNLNNGSALRVVTPHCEIRNNIFVANTGSAAVDVAGVGTLDAACNVFWQNPDGDYGPAYTPSPTDLPIDPLFCAASSGDLSLRGDSPCLPENNPNPSCGQVGATSQGCGAVSIESGSWSHLKSKFR